MGPPRSGHRKYHKLGGSKGYKAERQPVEEEGGPIIEAFRGFGQELDLKHDKYERIVKLSRTITIESKRIIFGLHSLVKSENPTSDCQKYLSTMKKLISTHFRSIALELENEDPYQFIRAYTAGIQEFIEALTLYYFMTDGSLYNWDQIREELHFDEFIFGDDPNSEENIGDSNAKSETEGPLDKVKGEDSENGVIANIIDTKTVKLLLPLQDYILGVQDLSGEVMRLCISWFSAGRIDDAFQACNFVRRLYIGMLTLWHVPSKEFNRKLSTLRTSLVKMETACYMMHVRGSEILHHMLPVAIEHDERNISSYQDDEYFDAPQIDV